MNRLAQEKSPYLLEHADNPVEWYPWGEEAFARARQENKPILLSIGYSTCHWCHVMARESFANPQVAQIMNANVIAIKVDREERPDIDKIYMSAVVAMAGSGGWPLNVFLTPELEPFFGGTYFPPHAQYGRAGWGEIVARIGKLWQDPATREKIAATGRNLRQRMTEFLSIAPTPSQPLTTEFFPQILQEYRSVYDPTWGGFSPEPKFPVPANLSLLSALYSLNSDLCDGQNMVLETLDAMARGGIYDILGGGFHRYSTDAAWHVPHFEKMLYDNAQLAEVYLSAWQSTQNPHYKKIAKSVLDYIWRDLKTAEGALASAEDADSFIDSSKIKKQEGAFYVWQAETILRHLNEEEAAVWNLIEGVVETGNVAHDPSGELIGSNVFRQVQTFAEAGRRLNRSEDEIMALWQSAREKLYVARNQRPRPHRDDKIITAWNAMAIAAYAQAAWILDDAQYLAQAQELGEWVWCNLYSQTQLARCFCQGTVLGPGIADDYLQLARAYLSLLKVDGDTRWFTRAETLLNNAVEKFYDAAQGGFFMTEPGRKHILIRVKEDHDSVEPSASSVAVGVCWQLYKLTEKTRYKEIAETTLAFFSAQMKTAPRSLPAMLQAALPILNGERFLVLLGDSQHSQWQKFLSVLRACSHAAQIILLVPNPTVLAFWQERLSFLQTVRWSGAPSLYWCENGTCRLPIQDTDALEKILSEIIQK